MILKRQETDFMVRSPFTLNGGNQSGWHRPRLCYRLKPASGKTKADAPIVPFNLFDMVFS